MEIDKKDILFEDKLMLVYHKHAGTATQTAKPGEQDAVSLVKNYLKTPYIALIHRLDQPVEGALIFAKTKEAAAALCTQEIKKRYYAVVRGETQLILQNKEKAEVVLTDYLLKSSKNNISRIAKKEEKNAKKAQLSFQIKKICESGKKAPKALALADISLLTGRHHQIRVQMAHAGLPLLGDMKYADADTVRISREMGIREIALCAYSLTFFHPSVRREMNVCITPEGKAFSLFLPITP